MKTPKAHPQEAKLSDYPAIQNMARFYVYDMSRYCGHLPGWECPDDGLFENFDLKTYLPKPEITPFSSKLAMRLRALRLSIKWARPLADLCQPPIRSAFSRALDNMTA